MFLLAWNKSRLEKWRKRRKMSEREREREREKERERETERERENVCVFVCVYGSIVKCNNGHNQDEQSRPIRFEFRLKLLVFTKPDEWWHIAIY